MLILALFAFVKVAPATAGILIAVTGSGPTRLWLGPNHAISTGWSQTATRRVSIAVEVGGGDGTTPSMAYLTTRIGPDTTAANEIAKRPSIIPVNGELLELFSDVTLGPGQYYVTLANGFYGSPGWFVGGSVVTTAEFSRLGDFNANAASYPPASAFFITTLTLRYAVIGTDFSNVTAKQVGLAGREIKLTWDFPVTAPATAFKIRRKRPSDTDWIELPGILFPYLRSYTDTLDLTIPEWSTVSYQIRAYQGATVVDHSDTVTCYQLRLQTVRSADMVATDWDGGRGKDDIILIHFQPDPAESLSKVAAMFGFDHFNWTSEIEYAAPSARFYGAQGNLLQAPFFDPAIGGYFSDYGSPQQVFLPSDFLPYYWDEQTGLRPQYFLGTHTRGGNSEATDTRLEFNDKPGWDHSDPNEYIQFSTHLVGVKHPIGTFPAQYTPLAHVIWSSNNRIGGGAVLAQSGSSAAAMAGGIVNAEIVSAEDLPSAVRDLLIQGGADNISSGLKIDNDAPETVAILSGTQGTGGLFTGPVTVTLLATDLDGPSDIASTTYSVDGGPVQNYTVPFIVSGNGVHVVEFGSVDRAGNAETPRPSRSFTISVAPPTIRCTGCYFLISGIRATLAFNASVAGSSSTFTYNYRSGAQIVQFASTTTSQIAVNGNTATFSGLGKLNGVGGYSFTVTAKDGGIVGSGLDTISVSIIGPNNYSYSAGGTVAGGDIVVVQ